MSLDRFPKALTNPSKAEGIDTNLPSKDSVQQEDLTVLKPEQPTKVDMTVSDRLEARAYSKENSAFFRSQVARTVMQRRRSERADMQRVAYHEARLAKVIDNGTNERELQALQAKERVESAEKKWEEYIKIKEELQRAESALEKAKSNIFRSLISELSGQRSSLESKINELSSAATEEDEIRLKIQLESAQNTYSNSLEGNGPASQRYESDIQQARDLLEEAKLVIDDARLEQTRNIVKDFYKKNLDLKRESEENPALRDITEISRKNSALIIHSFPMENEYYVDTSATNPIFTTGRDDGEKRAKFVIGIQPTISASAKRLDQFGDEQDVFYPTGLILAGGDLMSAYARDAGTFAQNLDIRHTNDVPHEYSSKQGQVSAYQPDIEKNIAKSLDPNEFEKGSYNEWVVRNPKVAALLLQEDKFTGSRELKEKRKERLLLLASETGLPLVEVQRSGELFNITEGKVTTLEELLNNPVTYSPDERLKLLGEANTDGNPDSETRSQIEKKLEKFTGEFTKEDPAMTERKKRNSDLAKLRLRLQNHSK